MDESAHEHQQLPAAPSSSSVTGAAATAATTTTVAAAAPTTETAPTTSAASGPRSLFDSRTTNASSVPDIDDDALDPTARYLSRSSSSASGAAAVSFDEAFAAIRQTASYTKPPTVVVEPRPSSTKDAATVVFVSRRQTGNPLLRALRNVTFEFRDGLVPDYVVNAACCVLFLSVRYHLLHGDYLETRLQGVKRDDPTAYRTKILLVFVDVEDNELALREINRLALLSQFTLVLAWSWAEAARYLETLKAYENKSAALIKEKVDAEFLPQAHDVLTTIRSVNKTDVVTLLSTFGDVRGVMQATLEELSLCPGIGAKKVRQLLETFHEPFTKDPTSSSSSNNTRQAKPTSGTAADDQEDHGDQGGDHHEDDGKDSDSVQNGGET